MTPRDLMHAFMGFCVGFALGMTIVATAWHDIHRDGMCRAYLSHDRTASDSLFTVRLWSCDLSALAPSSPSSENRK